MSVKSMIDGVFQWLLKQTANGIVLQYADWSTIFSANTYYLNYTRLYSRRNNRSSSSIIVKHACLSRHRPTTSTIDEDEQISKSFAPIRHSSTPTSAFSICVNTKIQQACSRDPTHLVFLAVFPLRVMVEVKCFETGHCMRWRSREEQTAVGEVRQTAWRRCPSYAAQVRWFGVGPVAYKPACVYVDDRTQPELHLQTHLQ